MKGCRAGWSKTPFQAGGEVTRVSGWIIFTVCFTTLLVGTWSAFTILEFYRADRKMREAERRGPAARGGAEARPRTVTRRPEE